VDDRQPSLRPAHALHLGMTLRDLGYRAETGEALAAAQAAFDAETP